MSILLQKQPQITTIMIPQTTTTKPQTTTIIKKTHMTQSF